MLFAEYVLDNKLGSVIGERSGNPANRYGESVSCSLNNSKLAIKISSKAFTRVDRENPSNYIDPDIGCAGYEALDKLFEEVYTLQELPSQTEEVSEESNS